MPLAGDKVKYLVNEINTDCHKMSTAGDTVPVSKEGVEVQTRGDPKSKVLNLFKICFDLIY